MGAEVMPRGRGINLYWAGRGRDSFSGGIIGKSL